MIVNNNIFSNRRKRIFFATFILFSIAAMFADFIANDKPILVSCNNRYYWPVFKDYPETEFGGYLHTKADYKSQIVQEYIAQNGWAVWPLIKFSYKTINYNIAADLPSPPNAENIFGTDDHGRDVLAQIIYGYRLSLIFSLLMSCIVLCIGISMGLLQGYLGGTVDILLQRFTEIWASLPFFFIVIAISYVVKPGFFTLLLILSLTHWTKIASMMRYDVLKVRNMDYILFARSIGVDTATIILKHIMPNSIGSVLSYVPFLVAEGMIKLAALDFLGFGLGHNTPSLGVILQQARNNVSSPWIAISAFGILSYVLIMLIFLGNDLRSHFRRRFD